MIRHLIFYILISSPLYVHSQDEKIYNLSDSADLVEFIGELDRIEIENKKWLNTLSSKGVTYKNEEIVFDEEAIKLLKDKSYREKVYREYTLYDVGLSFSEMDIKKAFWQIINIYPEKKDTLIQYVFAFEEILPVDEILLASFYTYAFFDPKITKLGNGKPDVYRPDIFEEYFRRTKEIIFVIDNLRNSKTK
ncbi:MAG: hypothetical protein ACJZZ9_05865 [Cytophagales bacterium]|tara:strand:+ start:1364 stop:1939 length:576 start_codon:yes stop_codon:yes gene_type:complete